MFIPIKVFKSPFLAKQFFASISSKGKPLLEIDGYPEYATSVNDLEPVDRAKIKDLAQKIVASHKTSNPIVSFVIHGHADVALRESVGNRAQVEQEKSEQRAHSVRNLMLQEIMSIEPTGKLIAATIHFDSVGFGSRFRKKIPTSTHSLTEAEMKMNRRIEIYTTESFIPLPPPPPKPTPQPIPKEIGTHWKILIKSGFVTSIITPSDLTSANVHLKVEITDIDRKQKAVFNSITTGLALPSATFGPPQLIQTTQVTEGDAPTAFSTAKGIELKDFAGQVSIAQDPGAGVSIASTGGNFNFSFEGMENAKAAFTRPKVISVSAGQGALTLPSGSLGLVSSGTINMKGTPVPGN